MTFRPRPNTQVSCMLILKRGNEILMSRRANTGHYDGYFSLPAGRVESKESVIECIIREAKEEIDIDINKNELTLVHFMHRFELENNEIHECLDFYFKAYAWAGIVKNNEPNKCSELKWFKTGEYSSPIPYISHAINNAENGLMYSEGY